LEVILNGTLFKQRPGGATYHPSPLNAAFFDQHESWYAVHWTTHFRPEDIADFCEKYLGLSARTCAIVQSAKEGMIQAPLGDIRQRVRIIADSAEFFRLDAQDYVIVWERSGEYERLRSSGKEVPFTAILGFGTDRFDPEFGYNLVRVTATSEIASAGESIWQALGFLGNEFKHGRIDPSRSYEQ
jgi:hypothetical protein